MNPFQRGLGRYLDSGWAGFAASVTVGVIGAGGLGSNCAPHLVRSGFSTLILADPDRVEDSNLNRQSFSLDQIGRPKVQALRDNLLAVNPDAAITIHETRVDESNILTLFGSCQAVVEAVDDPRAKKRLVETMAATGVFVVGASGLGGTGRTSRMAARALGPNLVIVGDLTTPCDAATPPLSPGVGMAAAMQADVILHHFLTLYQGRTP